MVDVGGEEFWWIVLEQEKVSAGLPIARDLGAGGSPLEILAC